MSVQFIGTTRNAPEADYLNLVLIYQIIMNSRGDMLKDRCHGVIS